MYQDQYALLEEIGTSTDMRWRQFRMTTNQIWTHPFSSEQLALVSTLAGSRSPIGFEESMASIVQNQLASFQPDSWALRRFVGSPGMVLDTNPGATDALTVMPIGHMDQIRMQARSVDEDGKIWINCDSFLPAAIIGDEVLIYSQHPDNPGTWRMLVGGTVQAFGAIHFSTPGQRDGSEGVKKETLYIELGLHGKDRKKQVEDLGVRPGDPVIFNREVRRGFAPDTFWGAYLDNTLGCFAVIELARLLAENPLENIRVLFTWATHEEIGLFGSRIAAGVLRPDVVLGVDVNHDYEYAPGIGDRRMQRLAMGDGATLTGGTVTSPQLNALIERVAREQNIPLQTDFSGRIVGTDAMAPFLASIDAATTSLGFPIRNMHTSSELGHDQDVLGAIHLMYHMLHSMDNMNGGSGMVRDDFRKGHIGLGNAEVVDSIGSGT